MPELTEKACVVCGMGSHRAKWDNGSVGAKGTVFVACDGHTKAEVAAAIAKAEPATPAPVPPTKTN